MPINQPILAVNTSSRASVRTTVVPVVPTIPPSPYYKLIEDNVVNQLQRNSTSQPGSLSGGSYTVDAIASPVDGAMTGDQWTGASTLIVYLYFIDAVNSGYYTFSFYARGVTPNPAASVTLTLQEYDVFGSGVVTLVSTTATATVGVWQRVSITAYIGRPTLPHYLLLGLDAGESIYLANSQFETGTTANAWISNDGAGGSTATQDVYTEFTQQPEREGQMVAFVQPNSVGVSTATLYVVVNISGTLTWKPVVDISERIDSRTGLPYDPNLNFYSSLGDPPLNIAVGELEHTVTVTLVAGTAVVVLPGGYYEEWLLQAYGFEPDIYPSWWAN
jgi:hypothetical protein